MLQSDKLKKVLAALDEACGHCPICSPDCPIAVAKRAIDGLYYDVKNSEAESGDFAEGSR